MAAIQVCHHADRPYPDFVKGFLDWFSEKVVLDEDLLDHKGHDVPRGSLPTLSMNRNPLDAQWRRFEDCRDLLAGWLAGDLNAALEQQESRLELVEGPEQPRAAGEKSGDIFIDLEVEGLFGERSHTLERRHKKLTNPIHRKAYLFALFTGLRRSEIENLEWDRIDDAIHLPTTKSGREFWLPLVEEHHRILDPMRGLDRRWVFPADSKSGHIVAWDHEHVPGTLHSLRHTFATVAVEAGIPEEVAGRLLNHASKTITGQRYIRPNLDFMRSAMQIVTDELRNRLRDNQLPRFKGQDQATPIYPNS